MPLGKPAKEAYIEHLCEELRKNMRLHFFENGEIDSVIAEAMSFDRRLRQKVLALLYHLSNTSSNLVPKALGHIKRASGLLGTKDMGEWISRAFDLLDSSGLEPAISFLSASDEASLFAFRTPEVCPTAKTIHMLETYVRAISGRDFRVEPAEEACTDTSVIYLPLKDHQKRAGKSLLHFQLSAAHKWAQAQTGSFLPLLRKGGPFEGVAGVAERALALDIYNILDAARLDGFLWRELPGLMKRARRLRLDLFRKRPALTSLPKKTAFVEGVFQLYLAGRTKGGPVPVGWALLWHKAVKGARLAAEPSETARLALALYRKARSFRSPYVPIDTAYVGRMKPELVLHEMKSKQAALRKRIEAAVTRVLNMPEFQPEWPSLRARPHERRPEPGRCYLLVKGKLIEMDEELLALTDRMGGVPGGVLVDGAAAGEGRPIYNLRELLEEEAAPGAEAPAGGLKYDEWDFRRAGYRKGWCTLFEHDMHPGHDHFVEDTLRKYGGYVDILKRKFELFRREPRLLKRQKEGEDIDIDAVVEAFADVRAGLAQPENLLVKLDRRERNIAVLFLLDMSGSTKGWVNEAEKEALVLMCEALQALGDRYAIYGFSGMTRNRCDFYRVKSFEEDYGDTVKRRIAGITPKDYTRMGPPLRHSAKILRAVEARTKILITLSDGKPEDYDAYKGDYGIEDTKRALIEAKQQGIHSFCITIDREAGSYLPHMYGPVNYTFIDDVRKLPGKMTEIYRRLTT